MTSSSRSRSGPSRWRSGYRRLLPPPHFRRSVQQRHGSGGEQPGEAVRRAGRGDRDEDGDDRRTQRERKLDQDRVQRERGSSHALVLEAMPPDRAHDRRHRREGAPVTMAAARMADRDNASGPAKNTTRIASEQQRPVTWSTRVGPARIDQPAEHRRHRRRGRELRADDAAGERDRPAQFADVQQRREPERSYRQASQELTATNRAMPGGRRTRRSARSLSRTRISPRSVSDDAQ